MKSVRLLPIVIVAALALLLFKGVGLLTNGGYVLTGAGQAVAAGAAPAAAPVGGAAATGDATLALPVEPTISDASPELMDNAPTMGSRPAADDHGGGDAHGDPEEHAESADGGDGDHEEASAPEPLAVGPAIPGPACPAGFTLPVEGGDRTGMDEKGCVPMDPRAELPPVVVDGTGVRTALADGDGTPATEKQLLERLTERRVELEDWEQELTLRLSLVEAAEKRVEERTAALRELEARINALVAEKETAEKEEISALIGMYETMKPSEAAQIFNQLQINVLVRLARGMSPRKMAPVLAKMSPARAQELTIYMAAEQTAPTIDIAPADMGALPQIVGQ